MRRTLPAAASICLSCSGLRLKHSYSFDLCDEDAADIGATPPPNTCKHTHIPTRLLLFISAWCEDAQAQNTSFPRQMFGAKTGVMQRADTGSIVGP